MAKIQLENASGGALHLKGLPISEILAGRPHTHKKKKKKQNDNECHVERTFVVRKLIEGGSGREGGREGGRARERYRERERERERERALESRKRSNFAL